MDKNNPLTLIQPNNVTSAKYNYSEIEENILTLMVGSLQNHMLKVNTIQKDLFGLPMISINTSEATKTNKAAYLKAAESLMKKTFSFNWKSPVDGKNRRSTGVLVSAFHNVINTSYVEITINTWAIPYLLYWGKGVGGTIFNKTIALTLKGQYAKRLYKLCKRWEDVGGFTISIKEFRQMLSLDKRYLRNTDLRNGVLNRSQKELKENADVYFNYTLAKVGSSPSYNQINFTIHGNNKKLSKVEKTDMYHAVFNIIGLAFPVHINGKAMQLTDSLADKPENLEKAYRRLTKLRNEYEYGDKKYEDVIRLVKHILKEDYNLQ